MLSTVMLMAAGALGAPSVKVAAPTGLCITEAESPAAAVDRIALTGLVHGVFDHVVVEQCTSGETAPLTVLEFVPVGGLNVSNHWNQVVSGLVDVAYSSDGRIVARGLTPKQTALLPRQTEVIPVLGHPMTPLNPDSEETAKLRDIKDKLSLHGANPIVERMIGDISVERMQEVLNYITGVTSGITTRNSIAPMGLTAAQWYEREFERYGFKADLEEFRTGYFPNVIATKLGVEEPDTIVVVGAHLDSRGRASLSATDPAPGANDDGSGSQALLQIARIISEYGADFKYTIVLGAWGGEEQGLVGSRAYAEKCKARGDKILAMIQADMLAYRGSGEGIQCGFPNRYADEILTDLGMSILNTYTPEIETCYTSACCSDHQSFYEQGYSATQYFERCGSIIDPQYHNAGDVVQREGYDLTGQLLSITRGYAATALTLAEFNG